MANLVNPEKKAVRKTFDERQKKAQQVFEKMAVDGLSLRKACLIVGMAPSSVMDLVKDSAELAEQYARARSDMLENMADQTLEIADKLFIDVAEDSIDQFGNPITITRQVPLDPQRARLMVDTRKWMLSKLFPRKYGDKIEVTGDPDRPLAIEKIERVIVNRKAAPLEDL